MSTVHRMTEGRGGPVQAQESLLRGDTASTLCFELHGPHAEATITFGIFYAFVMHPRAWDAFVALCPHKA